MEVRNLTDDGRLARAGAEQVAHQHQPGGDPDPRLQGAGLSGRDFAGLADQA